MDKLSRHIDRKVEAKLAKKYNLSKEEFRRLLRMHSEYLYGQLNELDTSKDLRQQHTRVRFPAVGSAFINRSIMIENEKRMGRMSERIYNLCRIWFSNSFRRYTKAIEKFNKTDID